MNSAPRLAAPGFSLWLAAGLLTLAGCGSPETTADAGSTDGVDASPVKEPSKVSLQVVDRAGYDAVVAKHKGQVVLVDFWATWCPPCMEQFPHTVELAKKYADAGLATISVSMDDVEEQHKALEFLKEKNAEFENLITTYGVGAEQDKQFEFKGAGVPHYKLYDRTGKLRYVFNDGLDGQDGETIGTIEMRIEIRIKELVAEMAE